MLNFIRNRWRSKVTVPRQVRELKAIVQELTIANARILLKMDDPDYDVNPFPTHLTQVQAIISRFEGSADYGCELVQRIVNLTAAFAIPHGILIDADDKAAKEEEYIKLFVDKNNLNEGVAVKLAIDAAMQGQVLTELIWDPDENMVRLKYHPWNETEYTVVSTGRSNLTAPFTAVWAETKDKSKPKVIQDDNFAFVAFNARAGQHEGFPRLGGVLRRLDAISRDLDDWRTINKLFGHPTPFFRMNSSAEAKAMRALIEEKGWTVGRALVLNGDFSLISPGSSYAVAAKESIASNVRIISGATGIAVHFLGFVDLMSNRSTADSLGEPVEIASMADITLWHGFYESLFNKAIRMRNKHLENKLDEGKVKPKMLPVTDRQWGLIEKVWIPMAKDGIVTPEAVRRQIPGFDFAEEEERQEKQTDQGLENDKRLGITPEEKEFPGFEED